MSEHYNQSSMLIALILAQGEINTLNSQITPKAVSVRGIVMI